MSFPGIWVTDLRDAVPVYILALTYSEGRGYLLWWGPMRDWTSDLNKAGLFTRADALIRTQGSRGIHTIVRAADALALLNPELVIPEASLEKAKSIGFGHEDVDDAPVVAAPPPVKVVVPVRKTLRRRA